MAYFDETGTFEEHLGITAGYEDDMSGGPAGQPGGGGEDTYAGSLFPWRHPAGSSERRFLILWWGSLGVILASAGAFASY
jgi:hypothetical protein